MAKWRCIKQCGACCHLDPEERPDLSEYLTSEPLELYLSLVGEGGWCIHFDHKNKECSIYDQRPLFCRVTPENFKQMFGVDEDEFNDFAIECCQQQITAVYGANSPELERYNDECAVII